MSNAGVLVWVKSKGNVHPGQRFTLGGNTITVLCVWKSITDGKEYVLAIAMRENAVERGASGG